MNVATSRWTMLAAWLLTFSLTGFSGEKGLNEVPTDHLAVETQANLAALTDGQGQSDQALAGLLAAVITNGEVVFEGVFGQAFIDPLGSGHRAMSRSSLVRIASVSKTLCAIVVMQLVDEGLLDLDRDVSDYLGWPLRNPNFPDRLITLRQLLSHTSSIRDAGESYIIRYPRTLREAFLPGQPEYIDRFQTADDGDRGPGNFYEYSNLNFGVIGTVLERVTGTRFDQLMQQRFYLPLGIQGGFNVAAFSHEERQQLATLYRKRGADGSWNPQGPWVPQVDDLTNGIPTALPDDADYTIGSNGAQFSPQGGARLSLEGLEALAMLLLGDGRVGETRLISKERVADLRQPTWQYNPDRPNMEGYAGRLHQRTPGLRVISSSTPGDRLIAGDDRRWFGHFGEAYGLLAGVWVQPDSNQALVYAITGTAFDPYEGFDNSSALLPIEAKVVDALTPLLTDGSPGGGNQ